MQKGVFYFQVMYFLYITHSFFTVDSFFLYVFFMGPIGK